MPAPPRNGTTGGEHRVTRARESWHSLPSSAGQLANGCSESHGCADPKASMKMEDTNAGSKASRAQAVGAPTWQDVGQTRMGMDLPECETDTVLCGGF